MNPVPQPRGLELWLYRESVSVTLMWRWTAICQQACKSIVGLDDDAIIRRLIIGWKRPVRNTGCSTTGSVMANICVMDRDGKVALEAKAATSGCGAVVARAWTRV